MKIQDHCNIHVHITLFIYLFIYFIYVFIRLFLGPPPTLRIETENEHQYGRHRGTSREESLGADSRYTDYESFLREVENDINQGMDKDLWDKDDYDYRGWDVEEAEGTEEEGDLNIGAGREEEVLAVSTTPS